MLLICHSCRRYKDSVAAGALGVSITPGQKFMRNCSKNGLTMDEVWELARPKRPDLDRRI